MGDYANRAKMAADAAVERDWKRDQAAKAANKAYTIRTVGNNLTFDEDGNPTEHFLGSRAQFGKVTPTTDH